MSTLAEIEDAAGKLPPSELERLVLHLEDRLRKQRAAHRRGNLAEHAGGLRLGSDPVEWQRRVRGEWG